MDMIMVSKNKTRWLRKRRRVKYIDIITSFWNRSQFLIHILHLVMFLKHRTSSCIHSETLRSPIAPNLCCWRVNFRLWKAFGIARPPPKSDMLDVEMTAPAPGCLSANKTDHFHLQCRVFLFQKTGTVHNASCDYTYHSIRPSPHEQISGLTM